MDLPVPELPLELRTLLRRQGWQAVSSTEQALRASVRPCVRARSERVGRAPLHRGLFARSLGLRTEAPRLPLLRSKLGGTPFATAGLPLREEACFIGQFNFAELPPCIPELPRRGLLALDMDLTSKDAPFVSRWYPEPSEAEAAPPPRVRCIGRYEAALHFACAGSLPVGAAWEALLGPTDDAELADAWNDWAPEGFFEEVHRLGGHLTLEPDALTRFWPPPGGPQDVAGYAQLLRLTFDNAADFGWGTNWLYLLVLPEDLAAGRLERVGLALANA